MLSISIGLLLLFQCKCYIKICDIFLKICLFVCKFGTLIGCLILGCMGRSVLDRTVNNYVSNQVCSDIINFDSNLFYVFASRDGQLSCFAPF